MYDVYSRHITNVQLQCDVRVREKEDEVAHRLAEQVQEVKRTKAAVVILSSMNARKRDKLAKEMEHFQAEALNTREELEKDIAALNVSTAACHARYEQELREQAAQYEASLSGKALEAQKLQERVEELELELARRSAETVRSEEEHRMQITEAEEIHKRVTTEQAEELRRRNDRIDDLEKQLQNVKRMMNAQAFSEAEKLRAELQEHVNLIMRIIPQDKLTEWQRENLPPAPSDLEDRARRRQDPKNESADRQGAATSATSGAVPVAPSLPQIERAPPESSRRHRLNGARTLTSYLPS